MAFIPNFNYHPGKRSRPNNEAAFDENGTPLYSNKKTAGTEKAEALLKTLVKPMPVPPRKYNGDFSR